jgi:phospholipid-binding lipoprotein MlaA
MILRRFRSHFIALVLAMTVTACASSNIAGTALDETNDPIEGFNRQMFAVNMTLDRYVLKPVATGYLYVPEPARVSVRNFLDNLSSPVTLANDALQGEWARASVTSARLVINTTVGLFGFFDPAARWGFAQHQEDFGQTLGSYGVGAGPYVYLPILGPSPPRDFLGFAVDSAIDPVSHIFDDEPEKAVGVYMVKGIDSRATNMNIIDEIERTSVDYYASVRSLYRQNRKSRIANGETNLDELPDIDDLDDDFDDE